MSFSAEARHRLTAILSTLVAVAIVAGGGIAQNQEESSPESLERLESDLRFQIESGFRLEPRVAKQSTATSRRSGRSLPSKGQHPGR